jgi:Rv2525c-like, glycoside hydrolase-like domain
MRAVDHSTTGARIGAALKSAGVGGVFRYAGLGRTDVNITAGEVADLRAHNIAIAIVNEHSAGYLLGGYQAGYDAAKGARDVCRAAGLPDGVIYMAGDSEQLQDAGNIPRVGDALRGAGDAIGRSNTGLYGSYYLIEGVKNRCSWIRYWWQTAAWSGGHRHPLACAYQEPRQALYGGVQCDLNEILAEDWGQRGRPTEGANDNMAITLINENGHMEHFKVWHGAVIHTVHNPTVANPGGWTDDWLSLGNPGSTIVSVSGCRNEVGHVEIFAALADGRTAHKVRAPDGWWPDWLYLSAPA